MYKRQHLRRYDRSRVHGSVLSQAAVHEVADRLLGATVSEVVSWAVSYTHLDVYKRQITDKLIARHPYVYGDAEVPDDLDASWERRKKAAKHRDSSLDGIADALPTLARAAKVAQRVHDVGPDMGPAQDEDLSISDREAGEKILSLVRRAQRVGVDADQATRAALRRWEAEIRAAEQS